MDRSIRINHEEILVKRGVNANNILDLVVHLKFERVHRRVEMNLYEGYN